MKKRVLALGFILSTSAVYGDSAVYRSTIDGRIGLLISVEADHDRFRGRIRYDGGGAESLRLEGTAGQEGGFEWNEILQSRHETEDKRTGTFLGRFTENGKTGEGIWNGPDGRKQRPFTLERIATIRALRDEDVDAETEYPVFDEPRFARLNERLEAEARQTLAENAQSVRSWREEMQDVSEPERLDHLTAQTSCDIQIAGPDLVSMLWTHYEYSGGAHGNTNFDTGNYVLGAEGSVRKIGLWDLLEKSPKTLKKLSAMLTADLERQKASWVIQGQIKNFVQDLGKASIPVTVIPAGLVFHFSPYAVGPYVEGSFRVVIPKRSLAEFRRRNGPLAAHGPDF
ncbi:DUF3298 domain-containing protein [Methylocaldum sp. MU1018]